MQYDKSRKGVTYYTLVRFAIEGSILKGSKLGTPQAQKRGAKICTPKAFMYSDPHAVSNPNPEAH